MAFKQYTHCIELNDYKDFWTNFLRQGQDPVSPLLVNAFLESIKYSIFAAIGGFLLGGGIGAAVGAAIGMSYGFIEGFADQWLNKRLICIKKDACATGEVAWIETPAKKDFTERVFDNDLSFNVQLTPYNGKKIVDVLRVPEFSRDNDKVVYDLQTIVDDKFPAAELLKNPDGWDLSYEGYEGEGKPNHPGGRWTLHGEFEGNAMDTLRTIGKFLSILNPVIGPIGAAVGAIGGAIYGAYTAGKAAAEAVYKGCKKACKIPILCDIVCVVVAAVAAVVAGIVGAVVGAILGAILGGMGGGTLIAATIIGNWVNTDGSFADAANDPESGNIEEGDCVFIAGDLVYDGGHPEGWHEIHPVKHIQKICNHKAIVDHLPDTIHILDQNNNPVDKAVNPDPNCCPSMLTGDPLFKQQAFRDTVKLFWDKWCEFYQTSQDPIVISEQNLPENQWCLHPLVDGCKPRREPDDSPPPPPIH